MTLAKLLLLIVMLNSMGLGGNAKVSYSNSVPSSVVLIQPSDAEFMNVLNAAVEPQSLAALQQLLPYAALARIQERQPLIAMVAVYRLRNTQGAEIEQRTTLRTLDLDPAHTMNQGDIVLIAPMLSKKLNLGWSATAGRRMSLNRANFDWSDRTMFGQSPSVTLSIDAIALADGTAIGSQATKLANEINADISAQREIETGIALRNGPALQAYREEMANAGRGLDMRNRPYEGFLRLAARSYLGYLRPPRGEDRLRSISGQSAARRTIPALIPKGGR